MNVKSEAEETLHDIADHVDTALFALNAAAQKALIPLRYSNLALEDFRRALSELIASLRRSDPNSAYAFHESLCANRTPRNAKVRGAGLKDVGPKLLTRSDLRQQSNRSAVLVQALTGNALFRTADVNRRSAFDGYAHCLESARKSLENAAAIARSAGHRKLNFLCARSGLEGIAALVRERLLLKAARTYSHITRHSETTVASPSSTPPSPKRRAANSLSGYLSGGARRRRKALRNRKKLAPKITELAPLRLRSDRQSAFAWIRLFELHMGLSEWPKRERAQIFRLFGVKGVWDRPGESNECDATNTAPYACLDDPATRRRLQQIEAAWQNDRNSNFTSDYWIAKFRSVGLLEKYPFLH